jgi:hypothetical protein
MSIQTRIELFLLRLLARIGVGRARAQFRLAKLHGLEIDKRLRR